MLEIWKKVLLILIVISLIHFDSFAYGDDMNKEIDRVLTSAETLFKSMKSRQYSRIWELLSLKSRNAIVSDTYKELKSSTGSYSEELVEKDFAAGDILSRAYWNAFLNNFDPVIVLEQSKWEIESISKDKAEIKITFKKADKPAILKMSREDGIWKVGLTETFWTRK